MKTSVIEVRDMLSVLSLLGVEKRIGEVPGVESVTVSYEAGNATVRYDETRLNIADIKADVRQRGYQADVPAGASPGDGREGNAAWDTPPATPAPVKPKPAPPAVQSAAPASDGQKDKSPSEVAPPTSVGDAPKPSPAAAVSAAPKSAPAESATPPGGANSPAEGEKDKAMPHKH